MKKQKKKKCKECEEEFIQRNSLQKYCSAGCTFKNTPKKKTKLQVFKKVNIPKDLKEYLENKSILKERQINDAGFNYCERCSKKCYPDCHHIIFRSEMPNNPNKHALNNLILLCRECHTYFHEKKDRRDYLVKERNLKLK
jgi:5-methylcytosine-specific restriction endonuclease McrA